jgi:hypothetical protein
LLKNDQYSGGGDSELMERPSANDVNNVSRSDNDPNTKQNKTNAHSQKSEQPPENGDNKDDDNDDLFAGDKLPATNPLYASINVRT